MCSLHPTIEWHRLSLFVTVYWNLHGGDYDYDRDTTESKILK
jgi:hypothetical protein